MSNTSDGEQDLVATAVEAFEAACASDPRTSIDGFVPPSDQPARIAVLVELIRVDLERGWRAGDPRMLDDYRRRFPEAFRPEWVPDLAYEEYRHRRFAGESVTPEQYRSRYGIDVTSWNLIPAGSLAIRYRRRGDSDKDWSPAAEFNRPPPPSHGETPMPVGDATQVFRHPVRTSDVRPPESAEPAPPRSREGNSPAVAGRETTGAEFPEAGTDYLGFRLLEELGRGAFGRVYLARQSDLSGRPVALKVACEVVSESRNLAQLQHTNIMPVYSYHRSKTLQAVCMPFFGRVTFEDVLRSFRTDNRLPQSGRQLRSLVAGTSRRSSAPGTHFEQTPTLPITVGNDWVKLEDWDYVRSIIWFGTQLAEGLVHAHSRGILHRDLKPANILISDDGRPMILDFNMAEDVKGRRDLPDAVVGGTIRYMSPEQLRQFSGADVVPDGRSDVYSLGAILFELLTGRLPYEMSDPETDPGLTRMVAERMTPPPPMRSLNPIVPWGVDAILRKCLAPNRDERYASALDLREDLGRELSNRPLRHVRAIPLTERGRKWIRRNPFVVSTSFVAFVAALFLTAGLAGWWLSHDRARTLEARETYAAHSRSFRLAQLTADDRNRRDDTDTAEMLLALLNRYGLAAGSNSQDWERREDVSRLDEFDRRRLRDDLGETYYLLANVALERARVAPPGEREARRDESERWNRSARIWGDRIPLAVEAQRRTVAAWGDRDEGAPRPQALPADAAGASARDLYLLSYGLVAEGRYAEALPGLRLATQKDPEQVSAWFVRGQVHGELQQPEMAAQCFGACVSLRPEFAPAWLNRGLAHAQMRFFDDATHDYDRAIALRPDWAEAFLQRATVASLQGRPADAERDLTFALNRGSATPRLYFLRASVRDRLGNPRGAAADRETGLAITPGDELSWVARGEQRMAAEPAAALTDVERALAINPRSVPALQLQAHLLSERLGRPDDAMTVLDRAIARYPESAVFRAGRGVLSARRGRTEPARDDARRALNLDGRAPNLYQVACIFALTSTRLPQDRFEAIRLLRIAVQSGYGVDLIDSDPDLNPLRDASDFQAVLSAAKSLHQKAMP